MTRLEMRIEPLGVALVILVSGLFFLLPGIVVFVTGLTTWVDEDAPGAALPQFAIGGIVTLVGVGVTWLGVRGLTTKVRFTIHDGEVRIQWLRFGRVLRHELLARDAIVDVGLDISPSSGGSVQCVVVGTTNGDVPLDDTKGSQRKGYDRQVRALASFLGVPVRPQ